MMLSFDEWNVWYHNRESDKEMMREQPWTIAPPVAEEDYILADAIAVGSMLLTMMRHAGRVKMACIAQLVNVLAPLMTETGGRMWKQPTWYPFAHASAYGRGELLFSQGSGPLIETPRYGEQPAVETIVTRDQAAGMVTVFAVNRSMDNAVPLRVDFKGNETLRLHESIRLHDADPYATNTAGAPDRVIPAAIDGATLDGKTLASMLPPFSWSVYRLEVSA